MRSEAKYILITMWLSSVYVVPVLIFVGGLLLHRDMLPHKSFCLNDLLSSCLASTTIIHDCLHHYNSTVGGQYCMPSNYRVIVLVIDALRFDFIEYQPEEQDVFPYHNKLKSVADLLAGRPEHTRLFRFIADPPTTTMQRIKGLTTGSLPTFIDIGSNFASAEIDEDNIIDTTIRTGKNVVFLGDDTWTKLYPNRFLRSFPFDSFNVWDLDTVDRGIEEHLLSEIRKTDWHLMVAHFLGVDHCGHRYGPNHLEMERKLLEMDFVIRGVVNEIQTRDDVMLLVIGDHGMTSTGDHGGETENEVTTAMFAYSPVHPFYNDVRRESKSVSQVDIVSTMAVIVGVPIPFSNTGRIVLECIPNTILPSPISAAFVLWQNIEQITNYVHEYSSQNNQFQNARKNEILSTFKKLNKRWFNVESANTFREFVNEYDAYMRNILKMCRQVWVQFDLLLIGSGIVFMLFTIILNLIIVNRSEMDMPVRSDIVFCSGCVFVIGWLMLSLHSALILFEIFALMYLGCRCFQWRTILCNVRISQVHFILSQVCLAAALFSNSFILEEPSVLLFFIMTCLWLTYALNGKHVAMKNFLVANIAYRVGFFAVRCREDQKDCRSSVADDNYNVKYPFMAAGLFFLLDKNFECTTTFFTFVSGASMVALTIFWIKESVVGDAFKYYAFVDGIPGLILTLCGIALCVLIYDPFLSAKVLGSVAQTRLAAANISTIVCIASAVLLGSSVSISSIFMVVCLQHMGVILTAVTFGHSSNDDIAWSQVILWSMSAAYWFYATGHYASFSAIQWNTAFVFQKNIGSSILVPGILVTMNTFASYIVHGLLLSILSTYTKVPFRNKNRYVLRSMITYWKYITVFAIRLLAMMIACALHSRHLMMWAIFAPKFIFEAIAFLVSIVSSLIGLIFVCRTYR